MEDRAVLDLPDLLRPDDVLVFNDTRVIPAQLEGRRGEASIGATLHKRHDLRAWWAFVRNARRVRVGDTVEFGGGVEAVCEEKGSDGALLLRFGGEEPVELLLTPRRDHAAAALHRVASGRSMRPMRRTIRPCSRRARARSPRPTASLHFTPRLLAALDAAGIARETLTLHVGAGTFLPVKADDTADHRMHAEWGRIDAATAERLNAARAAGGRIIAVGTTVLRLLESAAGEDGLIRPFEGDTAIFITPGYRFKAVDGLMTNFHLPRSTLFMLVSALMGLETMQARLRPRDRERVPLLQLWRFEPAAAAGSRLGRSTPSTIVAARCAPPALARAPATSRQRACIASSSDHPPDLRCEHSRPPQARQFFAQPVMPHPRQVAGLVEADRAHQQRHSAGERVEHRVAAAMGDDQRGMLHHRTIGQEGGGVMDVEACRLRLAQPAAMRQHQRGPGFAAGLGQRAPQLEVAAEQGAHAGEHQRLVRLGKGKRLVGQLLGTAQGTDRDEGEGPWARQVQFRHHLRDLHRAEAVLQAGDGPDPEAFGPTGNHLVLPAAERICDAPRAPVLAVGLRLVGPVEEGQGNARCRVDRDRAGQPDEGQAKRLGEEKAGRLHLVADDGLGPERLQPVAPAVA